MTRTLTGWRKAALYGRIAVHVAVHYVSRPRHFSYNPLRCARFLWRAWRLLLIFRHNRPIRLGGLYKLHLYLPAYPGAAFFRAIETKLLRSPPGAVTVVYSMTRACRYHCPHCYQKRDSGADLAESVMLDTALKIRDTGTCLFDIEGGEPLLWFGRLVRLVEALGDEVEVWVNTTGDGLEDGMLETLAESGCYGVMVSIHSANEERHDRFTGVRGSFAVACDVIRRARAAGLAVTVNSVLSEEELRTGGLDRLMDVSGSLDCDFVQLIHPKPSGLWLGRKENMQSDPKLIETVRRQHVLYNSRRRAAYPSLAAQVFEEAPGVLGCTAGAVDRFYVGADGEVQPCEFLNVSFGNVQDEPFETIYARMRAAFSEPRCNWLCCTEASSIANALEAHGTRRTPLRWPRTASLVAGWERGKPTPIYRALGIYAPLNAVTQRSSARQPDPPAGASASKCDT